MSVIDKIRAAAEARDKAKAEAEAEGFCNVCEEELDYCWCDEMELTIARLNT
jgi:hypothetical protein